MPPHDVTGLLAAWGAGDPEALHALLPLVYDELHRRAVRALRHEAPGHTLSPTALVNEAYLRLVGEGQMRWQNRAQFFGVTARLMRWILIDHARARRARQPAGGSPITLTEGGASSADARDAPALDALDVLAVHDALTRLGALEPELERLVELRYFGGRTIEETAEALGVAPATVKRQWVVARAWLLRELTR